MFARFIGVHRKIRFFYHKVIFVVVLLFLSIFTFSYFNLEFCYKIMAKSSLNTMCSNFKDRKYSGTLCEELCTSNTFQSFKCPTNGLTTAVFTAVKNHYIYVIKMARHTKDNLSWEDRRGVQHYPRFNDFQNIIRQYISVNYNITLDENVIQSLLSQEIDPQVPEHIVNIWRLFKDNNYMMGKLYEDDNIFPAILGSCGPFYATENLKSVQPEGGISSYISTDWEGRLKFSMMILSFLFRLDEVKPDPLKICKMEPSNFGIAVDKSVKYETAEFIQSETQIDKLLSGGAPCESDSDCAYENCVGKCDTSKNMCTGIQQNNNYQIACNHIFKGNRLFRGLLDTTKTPASLKSILSTCIDPSRNDRNHIPNRKLAPTNDIVIKLFKEIKRIYNEITFHQK